MRAPEGFVVRSFRTSPTVAPGTGFALCRPSARPLLTRRAGTARTRGGQRGLPARAGLAAAGSAASAFGLAIRGSQGAQDGQHRVQMGQPGPEPIDEVAQRKIALEQVFVVVVHVIG